MRIGIGNRNAVDVTHPNKGVQTRPRSLNMNSAVDRVTAAYPQLASSAVNNLASNKKQKFVAMMKSKSGVVSPVMVGTDGKPISARNSYGASPASLQRK